MKKEYKTPTAEKVVFDYAESVVACPSGCSDPGHTWHSGATYPACYHGPISYSAPSTQQGTQQNSQGTNQYYAAGWGEHCS